MKKFIISFIFTTIIFVGGYYLITLYDVNNTMLPRIISNKYYLLFLYISIVAGFSIYREDNNKSKLLVSFIFILNFLYLCSIFLIGNIGLTKIQCLIFVGLLLVGFLATLIKNWIGYIIIILSIIGDLVLIYISIIPLYQNGPDFAGFEEQFETEFIINSNVGINKEKASIQKDNKDYEILNGTHQYNFYIKEGGSEILFKSDNLYKNSYGFILFKGGEFVEITPQSALKINENYDVEVLGGNIKYYPENPKQFKITGNSDNSKKSNSKKKINTGDILDDTGDNQEYSGDIQTGKNEEISQQDNLTQNEIKIQVEDNEEIINIIQDIYNKKLKYYIKQHNGSNLQLDIRVLKLSKNTLELLNKFNPKYQNNLDNLQKFLDIFEINLDEYNFKQDINFGETTKNIINSFGEAINTLE